MVWAFLALLGTIALAILSLLLWPIRLLIRCIRGEKPPEVEPVTTEKAAERPDTASRSDQ
jgi:Na+-transporting methylmalonyl-CoA/oxaloacetate decarboxylase gamma subunit